MDIKEVQVKLLLDAIFQVYGYDFRHYQIRTITNRCEKCAKDLGLKNISDLISLVIHDRQVFNQLLNNLSISVTKMFREPLFFRKVRDIIMSHLKTYPYINIWHAGCATGEEVYSMAILLKEEEMLHRSRLYATDINNRSIEIAKKGIYPMIKMKEYTINYNQIGGKGSLADYYTAQYEHAKIYDILKNQTTFSHHNLVTDGVFSENQMIICKNVLIYFNKELQDIVLKLLANSLCHNGYLCLGKHESLEFSAIESQFEIIDFDAKIYQKKSIYA